MSHWLWEVVKHPEVPIKQLRQHPHISSVTLDWAYLFWQQSTRYRNKSKGVIMSEVCNRCCFSKGNRTKEQVESLSYCMGYLGSDGNYTWNTPMWADMPQEAIDAVANQMASDEVEKESDCFAYCPTPTKATERAIDPASVPAVQDITEWLGDLAN